MAATRTWVDLRQRFPEAEIERLIWGIRGERPGRPVATTIAGSERRQGEQQSAEPEEAAIRLLHLSDFHFRAGTTWDADPVLRALARTIGEEAAGGLQPDLVVITGDLAFSGRADEYRLAKQWLDHRPQPTGLYGRLGRFRLGGAGKGARGP